MPTILSYVLETFFIMPRAKSAAPKLDRECRGGLSEGCQHDKHEKSKRTPDISCFRCGARMGCGLCCYIAAELVCLVCKDWATKTAVRVHGSIRRLTIEESERELRLIAQGAVKEDLFS